MSLSAESRPRNPINWDERCALTGILAMRALQGWSIEQLMAYERGVKADAEGGAA